MADKEAEKIIENTARNDNDKALWLATWQEITDYVIPRKNNILTKSSPGAKRMPVTLFDSTAIHANDLLASSISGAFTIASLYLQFIDEELNDDEDMIEWLDECAKRLKKAWRKSNFSSQRHEATLDVTSIGTGCLFTGERKLHVPGFNGLRFTALSPNEYGFEENAEGFADTVYQKLKYTARQAIQILGENAGKTAIEAERKDPNRIMNYIHAVYPVEESSIKIPKSMKWAKIIVSVEDVVIVDKAGYPDFPYAIARWSKASGEQYGRSPAFNAMPDIKCLNKMKELGLAAIPKDLDPPLAVPEGVGKLKLMPGQQNSMRADLIDKIRPLVSNTNYRGVEIKLEDLIDSIRKTFYTDQLQIQKMAQMTATEANITFELMQRLLGPTFSRHEEEMYVPVAKRSFGIMHRTGAFPPPPRPIKNMEIDVNFVGPVVRSQKQTEAKAIKEWLETVIAIAGTDPDALDVPDIDAIIKEYGRNLGISEKLMRNKKDIEQRRKKREGDKQASQEQQMMLEGAKVLPGVSKALGMNGGQAA